MLERVYPMGLPDDAMNPREPEHFILRPFLAPLRDGLIKILLVLDILAPWRRLGGLPIQLPELFVRKLQVALNSEPNFASPFCHRMCALVCVERAFVGTAELGEIDQHLFPERPTKHFDVGGASA